MNERSIEMNIFKGKTSGAAAIALFPFCDGMRNPLAAEKR